jgi:chitin disaccharide deacetylase
MNYKAKIIVNGDDFGQSEGINYAILRSFNLGLISTATLMCNTPGFREACQIVRQYNLNDNIGIHLNITNGKPLTEHIKKHRKFYLNDEMYHSFKGHLLSDEEKRVIYHELQAQIDRCKKEGIYPTHIDSHHGMHNYWDIGKVAIELALRNKIPAVRLRVNWGRISKKGSSISNKFYNLRGRAYSNFHNYRIVKAGLAKTKYFCEIINVKPKLLLEDSYIEINAHPSLSHDNIIIDMSSHTSLSELEKKILPVNKFVTYKSIT